MQLPWPSGDVSGQPLSLVYSIQMDLVECTSGRYGFASVGMAFIQATTGHSTDFHLHQSSLVETCCDPRSITSVAYCKEILDFCFGILGLPPVLGMSCDSLGSWPQSPSIAQDT